MKQRVRRWKAMMMAVMLVLSIILPAKTVRAADSCHYDSGNRNRGRM